MNTELAQRLAGIDQRIQDACRSAGRARSEVTLIAVSKTKPVQDILALYALGQRDFGENYVQELLEKSSQIAALGIKDIRWHFIGGLQSNKVKTLLGRITVLHTLDRISLAQEIQKRWKDLGLPGKLPTLIELNIDREPQKAGILPEQLSDFLEQLNTLDCLNIQGLMCIPAPTSEPVNPLQTDDPFFRTRELLKQSQLRFPLGSQLSMGMTGDFERAIAMGSTYIRVGTALFGKR